MYFYEDYHYGEQDQYCPFQMCDESYPYHFHRCFELLSVIEGELLVTLDGKDYILAVGELVLIFPNQLHSFKTVQHSRFNIIIFSPDIIDDFVNKYHGYIPQNPILKTDYITLEKILTRNLFEQKSLLYHICGIYAEQGQMIKNTVSGESTLLHTILTFVSEHYHESCTLQELATQIGYEYTYLSKYFKDKMKISYTAFLNQLRIHQACELLKENKLSIYDIAFRCGFDTVRTFNRNFLNVTGMTPKDYRDSTIN